MDNIEEYKKGISNFSDTTIVFDYIFLKDIFENTTTVYDCSFLDVFNDIWILLLTEIADRFIKITATDIGTDKN